MAYAKCTDSFDEHLQNTSYFRWLPWQSILQVPAWQLGDEGFEQRNGDRTPTEFVKPGIYRTPKVPLQAWTHTIIRKNWGYLNFQVNTHTYISTWFCWTESWLNAIFFERLLLGLWSCDPRFVCQETLACPDAAFSIQRSTSNAMRASWFAITATWISPAKVSQNSWVSQPKRMIPTTNISSILHNKPSV